MPPDIILLFMAIITDVLTITALSAHVMSMPALIDLSGSTNYQMRSVPLPAVNQYIIRTTYRAPISTFNKLWEANATEIFL
jgi:hypothetical protein